MLAAIRGFALEYPFLLVKMLFIKKVNGRER
jgi:hypothetical protein